MTGWFTTDPALGASLHLASGRVTLPAGRTVTLAGANGVPYAATAALVEVSGAQRLLPVRQGTVATPPTAPSTLIGWFAP
ncbi:hypothetical protein ACFQZC_20455 [Streptacidiphilus monticola]